MNPNDRSEVDGIFDGADLTTLVDLQKFLADELVAGAERGADFSRAFTPLTDGLGLQNEAKPQPAGATRAGKPGFTAAAEKRVPEEEGMVEQAVRPSTRLIIDPEVAVTETADVFVAPPPPVPSATLGRRALGGFVDWAFVLCAWFVAMAITSKALSTGSADWAGRVLRELSNPAFQRSAGLEFAVIWLGYLVLSLGILDMTFGMWVWGLRVHFGEGRRFSKKLVRILLGTFVYPLVAPALTLVFRKDGRSWLDRASGSRVYRI